MLVPEDMTSDTLLAHYLECESLRYLANKAASHDDIICNTLRDMSVRLGIDVDDQLLQDATRTILKIGFYPDAIGVIKSLHHRGYMVVGLPLPLQNAYSLPEFPPEILTDISCQAADGQESLFLPTPSVFPALHQRCQVFFGDIQPTQILVVTARSFRTVKPATAAGFPTVLLPTSEVYKPQVDTKVLGSHPGFPRLRWPGTHGETHAFIMDTVGPTLQHLLRLCRGKFTHKTVTMLALQMVNIFIM
jgi:hypothetical protein